MLKDALENCIEDWEYKEIYSLLEFAIYPTLLWLTQLFDKTEKLEKSKPVLAMTKLWFGDDYTNREFPVFFFSKKKAKRQEQVLIEAL